MCCAVQMLLTAVLLTLARAQDCPPVDHVNNIDLDAYAQGTWYEIARYTNNIERDANCVTANYTKRGDKDYVIKVSEVTNGKLVVYDAILDLSTDDHLKGVVNYVFYMGNSSYRVATTFVAMDYNSYGIKYTCMTDPKTNGRAMGRVEMAWIFSRTKQLSDSAKTAIDSYLSSSRFLDKSKFFYDDFSDDACK